MNEPRRWTNPSLPQTLQIAVILLYINAFFGLLALVSYGVRGRWGLLFLGIVVGQVMAGSGIASEQKSGYQLGIAMAVTPFLLRFVLDGLDGVLGVDLITLMFEIALVALLLHPQSKEHQRIWFS